LRQIEPSLKKEGSIFVIKSRNLVMTLNTNDAIMNSNCKIYKFRYHKLTSIIVMDYTGGVQLWTKKQKLQLSDRWL